MKFEEPSLEILNSVLSFQVVKLPMSSSERSTTHIKSPKFCCYKSALQGN